MGIKQLRECVPSSRGAVGRRLRICIALMDSRGMVLHVTAPKFAYSKFSIVHAG